MGKTGDVHGIDHMLREIKENGLGHLVNNNIIWNTTMAGYACNGLRDKGYRMFEQMMKVLDDRHADKKTKKKKKKRKGIPAADAESFRIYMDMLIFDGKRQDAIDSLDVMIKMGVKPNITIYNTLYGSFLKKPHEWVEDNEIELLQKLYSSMKKIKAKPNSETMYTLVSAFLDLGDTKSALESFVYLSNIIETKPTKDVQSHSVALLTKERYRSIKDPTHIEPSRELLDRLNRVVSESVI
jgi:pentatricopeptide repeat protein